MTAAPTYATDRLALRFGATELELDVVAHLEEHIDTEALLRDADAPEPPYWIHLWTGGRALAREVARLGDWRGKYVADLGCGLGLAGLVAARLGARVVLVDAVFDALRLARDNARLNRCEVDVVQGDLLRLELRRELDAILLADVTYDPALQRALAEILATQLKRDGVGLCAESVRNQDPGFRLACEAQGLEVRDREVREEEEGHAVPVRLTEVRRT